MLQDFIQSSASPMQTSGPECAAPGGDPSRPRPDEDCDASVLHASQAVGRPSSSAGSAAAAHEPFSAAPSAVDEDSSDFWTHYWLAQLNEPVAEPDGELQEPTHFQPALSPVATTVPHAAADAMHAPASWSPVTGLVRQDQASPNNDDAASIGTEWWLEGHEPAAQTFAEFSRDREHRVVREIDFYMDSLLNLKSAGQLSEGALQQHAKTLIDALYCVFRELPLSAEVESLLDFVESKFGKFEDVHAEADTAHEGLAEQVARATSHSARAETDLL